MHVSEKAMENSERLDWQVRSQIETSTSRQPERCWAQNHFTISETQMVLGLIIHGFYFSYLNLIMICIYVCIMYADSFTSAVWLIQHSVHCWCCIKYWKRSLNSFRIPSEHISTKCWKMWDMKSLVHLRRIALFDEYKMARRLTIFNLNY